MSAYDYNLPLQYLMAVKVEDSRALSQRNSL
jgi:hypothetical protein